MYVEQFGGDLYEKVYGLITGLLIAIPLVGFAATKNIKKASFNTDTSITIDGKPSSLQLIAVTLDGDTNGSNYAPVRSVVEAMGGEVSYNAKTKNIDIQTQPTKGDKPESKITENPTSTPDGITMIDHYQGKYYIGYVYANRKIIPKGYIIKDMIQIGQNKYSLLKIIDNKGKNPDITPLDKFDWEIVLDNLEISTIYGYDEIEYNYYVNTILPLIK